MVLILIGFFGGFLVSSILDTTLGEYSEWAIVGAALIVATIESFNKIYYSFFRRNRFKQIAAPNIFNVIKIVNYFKIGIIYGLIVDAFKLGS